MEDLLYWIIEYIKVLLGYGFIMFVWPSAVFRKYLKGKSVTFRFGFCATVPIVLINTVVLMLGLLHILNRWTMWIFFYGLFIWSFREKFKITEQVRKKFKYLVMGTFGWKHLGLLAFKKTITLTKKVWKYLWKIYKIHWLEYSLLVVTVVYGMLYFSWGAFQNYSYGFGDMYVHHAWTYGLVEGKIFSAGVYPEAMHCVIYAMHILLGIDIYSCMLFLAGIHIALILISAYCLMKEVFHWRYSSVFVLILFLITDAVCVNQVFSMSRLQWTLPQEYGFHTMYLCALFLILYLKGEKTTIFRGTETKGYWDENLFVFMMSLAASIAIHFYATIMAFLICLGFAVFSLKQIFHKKRFVPLVVSVMCGVLIAVIPMGGALLSGIEFQGSIGWAMYIMNGVDPEAGFTSIAGTDTETSTPSGDDEQITVEQNQNEGTIHNNSSNENQGGVQAGNIPKAEEPGFFEKISVKISSLKNSLFKTIKEKWMIIYKKAYVTLYKTERANWIIGLSCIPFVLWGGYKIIFAPLYRRLFKRKLREDYFTGYLSVVMDSFLFMVIYAAAHLGLPGLVAGARLCSTEQMLVLMVIMVPIDLVFATLKQFVAVRLLQVVSLFFAAGLVWVVWKTDSYHGYLYYELTRYNATVTMTNEIMDTLPENTYTIVSPTDELYQVIQKGRHEELLNFLTPNTNKRYTIPTEYVFIYVEKRPIKYAHNHFFSGPDWLALEKYQDFYSAYEPSVYPDVTSGVISEEAAQMNIMYFGRPSQSYSNIDSRIILESKAYEWCKRFQELYPNEMKVYYEDDDLVCYYFRQNTQYLYDLVIE